MATHGLFVPDPACKLMRAQIVAGGGPGYSTSNFHEPDYSKYGPRGEDSYFHLRPSMPAMFALAPDGLVAYCFGPHNLVHDQAIFFTEVPSGVGLELNKPYFPINLTATTFKLSLIPYQPPLDLQSPIIVEPIGQNPIIMFRPVWYGVQGGGCGGIIGDQGTPMGYWGLDGTGPEGVVQSFGLQGGAGHAGFKLGGSGGVNAWGGQAGSQYQNDGIDGVNGTGAGGGGAAPCVDPALDWGGTGGAAGAFGEIWLIPQPGESYFCWAGRGGEPKPAGPGGFRGGKGGHGQVLITQFF